MVFPERIDPAELIGPVLSPAEPEIRAVTATTIFGAFGRGGTSGPFGNETDSALLLALRDWADVILVGAGTARAEDVSHISQVIAPQLLLDGGPSADSRLLFGVLTVVFSMAAAGLWFWSFRGTAGHRTRNHGKRISQS